MKNLQLLSSVSKATSQIDEVVARKRELVLTRCDTQRERNERNVELERLDVIIAAHWDEVASGFDAAASELSERLQLPA